MEPGAVFGDALKPRCAYCAEVVAVVKRCGECESALYCGRACQVADWKAGHGNSCARLRLGRRVRFVWPRETGARRLVQVPAGVNVFDTRVSAEVAAADLPAEVAVDCAHFMQVVAGLCAGRARFNVGYGRAADESLRESAARESADMYFLQIGSERLRVWYLTASGADVCECLAYSSSSAGQWLAGPDSRGHFLGMAMALDGTYGRAGRVGRGGAGLTGVLSCQARRAGRFGGGRWASCRAWRPILLSAATTLFE